ncbi:MAG: redoxin domain-containing protein [Verrucomicrobia bacterium]|nr:redoxin domain-containing protein [Verrucomicrobiota bacterium]
MSWTKWLSFAALAGALFLSAAEPRGAQVLEQRFKELDANGDGKLTAEEAGNADWFKRLDREGRGYVTREQIQQIGRLMQNVLADGAGSRQLGQSGEALFKWLDKNTDGKLTRDELPKADSFDRLDLDHDGFVTLDEAKTALSALAAKSPGALPTQTTKDAPEATEEKSPRQGPKLLKAGDAGVGRLVADLSFTDINGKAGKLGNYKPGKALVIAFTSTSCPVTKRFAPTLARLEKDFAGKGVAFLFVNPTESDSLESIKADIQAHGFAGRYIHDKSGALAQALGATSTAEVFVLDATRTLVYRGAVSDQYGLAYSLDEARHHYLADALNAVLAGTTPEVAATTAPGCALDTKVAKIAKTDVTYHNQISRILQHNCVECHRADGVAPFTLESYDDAKSHAGMMRKQVGRGVMPPWFAAPGAAGEPSHWANDRSLAPQDKADLLVWLAGDKPPGNSADAPLPRKFSSAWFIGEPDAVFQLPRAVAIKAEGTMPYQFVTVETSFPEDRWVNAYEIMPTAREVVHHVIVKVHPKGAKVRDAGEGTEGYWAAYVPGNSSRVLPDGFAKRLPAGATISFQIHYTPNGRAVNEQLKLGVKFAKEPPEYAVHVAAVPKITLKIPPGAANHVEVAEQRVPADMTVSAFMAHMHVRGKAFKFEVTYPDGRRETLLDIPHYDFNWQLRYECAEARQLPAGSVLKITAVYDNSTGNPANPDPAVTVRWGPQTFHEMMIGYVEYYTRAGAPAPAARKLRRNATGGG